MPIRARASSFYWVSPSILPPPPCSSLATGRRPGRRGFMVPVRTYRVLDHDYPHALRDLTSPPDPMCVRGELLGGPAVAIVGTRDATGEALLFARDLAWRLAERGVTVWSGGAIGIDAAAHRGALDAGGISVAVVPTGLDHCYPKEPRAPYDGTVDKGGAIV